VGPLPGPVSESGVAVLPEEQGSRNPDQDDPLTTSKTVSTPPREPAGSQDSCGRKFTGNASEGVSEGPRGPGGIGGEGKLDKKGRVGSLTAQGGTGGVGTLSWAGSESSIALLPEEKNADRASPGTIEQSSGTNGEAKVSVSP
jgi:hypothetical protein